ncbi:amidohydrolase family protein [Marinivivus vitaminiproducens]|uniref:amidohydrolase family protein n=1 Tax=Marinivivus vitaminiproducens TaxID=3035935 RepID=UPI0027A7CFF9|nr:amidohydrolase family protein [Geminicoccaceae bacterium SCSIO 64248]
MRLEDMGAIDCDMHPVVPNVKALVPFLSPHWQASVADRGIPGFDSISYPPNAPLSARPEWREAGGAVPSGVAGYQNAILDRWKLRYAIGNCLYGVHLVMSDDMAVAFATAVNKWMAATWLDADPRMRASIVIPVQDPERAVDEIDRCAQDPRFVQILVPAMADAPLGRRQFWPIYQAAVRHGLTLGIHAGSSYKHPVTPVGWPSYYVEDYASQAVGFQGQVASLICEGVFNKFPELRVVLLESGVSWFTPFLWRLTKFRRGTRSEIPWVDRPPIEIARDHFHLTTLPFDAPADPDVVMQIATHLQADAMLLFASDYPHWQFDGDAILPAGLDRSDLSAIAVANAFKAYPRLQETVQ